MAFTASGFDPRLRAGGDSTGRRASTHWRSFDPRLRAGGDVLQFVSDDPARVSIHARSEEHTSELQSLMRISYAVFCLKKKRTCHLILRRYDPQVHILSPHLIYETSRPHIPHYHI